MVGTSGASFSGSGIRALMGINRDIASVIGQRCAFRPEVSLLIELYLARKQNQQIEASVLGLASGIPQPTAVRWLRYFEEQGWVVRIPHETDQTLSYPHLTPSMFIELDTIFHKSDG